MSSCFDVSKVDVKVLVLDLHIGALLLMYFNCSDKIATYSIDVDASKLSYHIVL